MGKTFWVGKYVTRSGLVVAVEKVKDGTLYGSAYRGEVKLEWNSEGRKKPVGGEDPLDLVEEL